MAKPTAKLEKITPTTAKKWLKELNYEDNRNINSAKVEFLKRQHLRDHWVINGATICFDTEGQLIDGQHRLSACVESKKGFETFVVRGLNTAAYTTIDQGWKRSHVQVLSAAGHKNAKSLVTACKHVWILETEKVMIKNRIPEISIDEVQLVVEYKPELKHAVALVHDNKLQRMTTGGLLAYLAWMFCKINEEKALEFFARLGDGANLAAKHPILTLRDRLMRAKADSVRFSNEEVFSFVVRAWNAYRLGKNLTILRLKTKSKDGSKVIELPKVSGWK
jgi:hypothetical protein